MLCRLRKRKEASKKVKVGDMFYAQASDSAIQQGGECGGAVTATLKYLLENKIVDGVLAMKRGKDIYDGVPSSLPIRRRSLSRRGRCTALWS